MPSSLARFLPRRADYDLAVFRSDLLAGVTVAVVALPLALGFGITSGAGAAAGLYTAMAAGILAAVFGGSNLQVSGPTGAMTVVLLPLVSHYGVAALAPVGLLAGLFLLVFAAARIGRFIRYIPYPVITGFTIGIAVIIFLQQLPGFLGAPKGEGEQVVVASWQTLRAFADAPGSATPLLGLLTVGIMVGWGRIERLRAFPASMAALLAGTGLSLLPVFATVARIPAIPTGLPVPALPSVAGLGATELVRAALVIAVLAALESLLSAVVADGMTIDERHDPERELFGQGIANIGSAVVGGIPATAALARTAVNVRSGARTRLAAIIHGLILAAIMVALAPLASRIPLVALAAILMVVAARMVELAEFREILRATKSDAATMLLTLGVTVAFDLILAIEVGLIAAGALFVTRMSQLFQVDTTVLGGDELPLHERRAAADAEHALRRDDLVVYRIEGPIFFGAADRFFEELLRVDRHIRIVVLRMRRVPVMDVTGAAALRALVARLSRRGIVVMLSGVQEQPRSVLERTGILAQVTRHGDHLFDDTDQAIAHARQHLANHDHTHPARTPA
ncbi:SulP family inorganic anion transporter [Nitriliruptor alkaliphilus]|uniref:SulP family inorganic anion transporter n=1 Tax=Nitriliruptor alkaliphilus TaxID=427918 RepID=UPI000696E86E|nr:SulP family inorganic anion transporter [Nitriliruptor alkaliphilus]